MEFLFGYAAAEDLMMIRIERKTKIVLTRNFTFVNLRIIQICFGFGKKMILSCFVSLWGTASPNLHVKSVVEGDYLNSVK